jgi:acetyl esterase/lipase
MLTFHCRAGVLALVLCLACAANERAQAQAPATNDNLKQLLKQFPKADANGDGVLTQPEARAYRAAALAVTPTKSDVAYGQHARNVLDFYAAKSAGPTPVIVFIHGGGFVAGDKKGVDPNLVRGANERGISVASINYRFVDGRDVIFPAPQQDGARAVQFLRSQTSQWNIRATASNL